ncbi:MAG: CHASE3 domain-containing protein [Bacteroidia bacterium]
MEKYNNKRTKVIFFFATVFLVTLSILSYIRIKNLIDNSRWVNHTNVVKFNLRNTFSYLLEMEANQRGFIITHDSAFISSYKANVQTLDSSLVKIDSLTTDNLSQQRNANQLRTLIETRKKYMHGILDDASKQTISLARMLGGKSLMDEVRRQINKMESEEDKLLSVRTTLLNKETFLTPIVTFFLILSAIMLLIVAYNRIMKDLRLSNALRVQIQNTNSELELKNTELAKSEERFFKIFDNNPVALTFGEIGSNKITYANKLFYTYFGFTNEDEVIGHTSEELNLISPEENARILPIIMSYLDENRSVAELQALPPEEIEKVLIKLREKMFGAGFEVVYTKKNKETFNALVFYEIIAVGGKKFALTSYQDITDLKRKEQKIEKQNEDLIKMNKELESFNYISSHDLQEPLRKIQIFSSQIVEKDHKILSEKGKELFQRIQNSASKMQTLIQDLLAYSRTNVADRIFEITDVKKIVEDVKEELKDELLQKNGSIEIGDMCNIKVIPFQFRQLIYNLVSNSLKFSKLDRTPEIKIKSQVEKGSYFNNEKIEKDIKYCHISVSDNGIGFEEQYKEKIFEVFQQLHRKNEYKGTGIGLAIVKKIVENHNGVITVQSTPGEGATFNVYIPEMNNN